MVTTTRTQGISYELCTTRPELQINKTTMHMGWTRPDYSSSCLKGPRGPANIAPPPLPSDLTSTYWAPQIPHGTDPRPRSLPNIQLIPPHDPPRPCFNDSSSSLLSQIIWLGQLTP